MEGDERFGFWVIPLEGGWKVGYGFRKDVGLPRGSLVQDFWWVKQNAVRQARAWAEKIGAEVFVEDGGE